MIGDVVDVFQRLKRILPRWFGEDQGPTPVVDGLLQAPATALSGVHALYAYAKLQTRIATATGGWLDLIAHDFFGGEVVRQSGQSDASFRAVIIAELFRPKATRPAVIEAITRLTGTPPRVFEPGRAADTGGYGVGCGYGVAGGYGSLDMPAQAFVEVVRPRLTGTPNVSGYGHPAGGFNTAAPIEWSASLDPAHVVDAQIYAALNRVRPVGVTLWVRIVAAFEDFAIVGGSSAFEDDTTYSDGSEHDQPTVLI